MDRLTSIVEMRPLGALGDAALGVGGHQAAWRGTCLRTRTQHVRWDGLVQVGANVRATELPLRSRGECLSAFRRKTPPPKVDIVGLGGGTPTKMTSSVADMALRGLQRGKRAGEVGRWNNPSNSPV